MPPAAKDHNGNSVLFVHDGPLFVSGNRHFGKSYSNALVNRYKKLGDRVTFLMRSRQLEGHSGHHNEIDSPGFRFTAIPDFKSVRTIRRKSAAKKIIHRAVMENDVILVRLPSAAGSIAFRYARMMQKPVLVEMVACVFDALWNYNLKGKMLAHYKYRSYRNLMKHATHTIYVTERFLQDRYPAGGKWVACSDVVLDELDDRVLERRLEKIRADGDRTEGSRAEGGREDGDRAEGGPADGDRIDSDREPVLGTVAALDVAYKGQADVIRALAKLKEQGHGFRYRLVGGGNPARLRELAGRLGVEDRVEITGPLKHEEVFRFLDGIDVYMQPSKQEGLPRAVVEAMSRGCPVVGSTAGGIPELIGEECLFRPGDTRQIAALLKKLDQGFLEEQARVNFQKAKNYERKSLDRIREGFYETFKSDHRTGEKAGQRLRQTAGQ